MRRKYYYAEYYATAAATAGYRATRDLIANNSTPESIAQRWA